MQAVRSGFGDHAHDSAAAAPVLGGVIVDQDLELLDRVGIRVVDHAVAQQVVVHAAVEQVGHRVLPSARDAEAARASRRRRDHSGLEQREVQHVAPVERRVHDLAAGDRVPERGDHRLHARRVRLHLHRLRCRSDFQLHVDTERLVDLEWLRIADGSAEARCFHADPVRADRNRQYLEAAVLGGNGVARDAGRCVRDRYLRARNDGARRIGDSSDNSSGCILGPNGRRQCQQENNKQMENARAQHNPSP